MLEPKPPNYRKDMVGIDVNVDIRATRVNLDRAVTPKEDNPIVPNYKGDPKQRNVLRSILSGSLRSPDRLLAANLATTDACTHPDCEGATPTTDHIFWECHHYKPLRKLHSPGIGRCMRKAYAKGSVAYNKLLCGMKQPCFRNCGICPGDDSTEALQQPP